MQPCIAKLTHTHTLPIMHHTQSWASQAVPGHIRSVKVWNGNIRRRKTDSPRSSVPPRWSRGDALALSLHLHWSQTSQNQNPGPRQRGTHMKRRTSQTHPAQRSNPPQDAPRKEMFNRKLIHETLVFKLESCHYSSCLQAYSYCSRGTTRILA